MPFATEFDEVYEFLIKAPLEEHGYEVHRADDLLNQNNILQDIVSGIIESDLIIADLSQSNANVYYEVGLAHASGKKVVLLTQDIDEVPFDLRSYRIVAYSTHFSKMNEAQCVMRDLVKKHSEGSLKFSSPVSDYAAVTARDSAPHQSPVIEDDENSDDRGLLDYEADLEESMETIGKITVEIGTRLGKLTASVNEAGNRISGSAAEKTKQKRETMRALATEMDEFSRWVKTENVSYSKALLVSKECLDGMLSGEFKIGEGSPDEAQNFIDTLGTTADGAISARDSFQGMLDALEGVQRIEREFDRARRSMAREVADFVANIDQTASVVSRARYAAKGLLEKTND